IKKTFLDIANTYPGITGHTDLNEAGDRKDTGYDFWTIKPSNVNDDNSAFGWVSNSPLQKLDNQKVGVYVEQPHQQQQRHIQQQQHSVITQQHPKSQQQGRYLPDWLLHGAIFGPIKPSNVNDENSAFVWTNSHNNVNMKGGIH